jgi:hypothetical protein
MSHAHESTVCACEHVLAGNKPEMLFVNETQIDYAMCLRCARMYDGGAEADIATLQETCGGMCACCVKKLVGDQTFSDGFWILQEDGNYLAQEASYAKHDRSLPS